MLHPDTLELQLEALAIASGLRRYGDTDVADLVERWAASYDLMQQLTVDDTQRRRAAGSSPAP